MKAIKFFGMLFAAFAISFTATSCGSDDDIEDLEQKIEDGDIKTTVSISESKDQIVLVAKTGKVSTQTYTAKFRDGKCASCVLTAEFSTKLLADEFERANDGEMELKRDGNKFTADLTEDFAGMDYALVKSVFESIKRTLEGGRAAY